MSLNTRCPICATTFKVVPDQLRISDGWVRCGRCGEVFDAAVELHKTEALGTVSILQPDRGITDVTGAPIVAAMPVAHEHEHDHDQDDVDEFDDAPFPGLSTALVDGNWWSQQPSLDMPAAPTPQRKVEREAAQAVVPVPEPVDAPVVEAVATAAESDLPRLRASESSAANQANQAHDPDDAIAHPGAKRLSISLVHSKPVVEPDSGLESATALDREVRPGAMPVVLRATEAEAVASTTVAALGEPVAGFQAPAPVDPVPSFLDLPVRSASPRGPKALAVLALLAILATVLLAGQLLRHERDVLAARQPALAPVLDALCRLTGCQVAAPRQIAAFSVDGASFSRESDAGEGYRLYFSLRNSAAMALAMPAIELTLLDTQERPVLRRVLLPADFGAPPTLAAGTERATSLRLALKGEADTQGGVEALPPIAGYHVVPFYP